MKKKILSIVVAIAFVFTTVAQPIEVLASAKTSVKNTVDRAISINYGQKYNGNLEAEECDVYKFTLNASGKIRINSVGNKVGIWGIDYIIKDEDNTEVWDATASDDSAIGQNKLNEEVELIKGVYYLEIKNNNFNHRFDYHFNVTYISANESFTETIYDNNNMLENSDIIKLGTTYKGQLAENDTRDFYKFTLNSSGEIKVFVNSQIKSFGYNIYDSEGEELLSREIDWDQDVGASRVNDYIYLTKGTYYFRIGESYEWKDYTGNYLFSLGFTSANESFVETGYGNNNSIDTSDKISLNTTYKGQIALNDEADFYRFYVPKKQKIVITIKESDDLGYIILDSHGNNIWSKDNWEWNDKINSQTIELNRGTYYLNAYYRSWNKAYGNYSFKLTSLVKPLTPVIQSTKRINSSSIKIAWKPVSKVTGYQIYRSTTNKKGSYKLVKTVSSKYKEYTNTGLKTGTTYYWKVRAYRSASGERVYSNLSKAISRKATLLSPSNLRTEKVSSRIVRIRWNKVEGASGYMLYRSAPNKNGSFKRINTVNSKYSSLQDKSLKKGKRYYWKMKAYKVVNGKRVYSGYSKTISRRV